MSRQGLVAISGVKQNPSSYRKIKKLSEEGRLLNRIPLRKIRSLLFYDDGSVAVSSNSPRYLRDLLGPNITDIYQRKLGCGYKKVYLIDRPRLTPEVWEKGE